MILIRYQTCQLLRIFHVRSPQGHAKSSSSSTPHQPPQQAQASVGADQTLRPHAKHIVLFSQREYRWRYPALQLYCLGCLQAGRAINCLPLVTDFSLILKASGQIKGSSGPTRYLVEVTTSSDYESGRSRLLTRAANEATRLNTQNTGKITSFGKMGEAPAPRSPGRPAAAP